MTWGFRRLCGHGPGTAARCGARALRAGGQAGTQAGPGRSRGRGSDWRVSDRRGNATPQEPPGHGPQAMGLTRTGRKHVWCHCWWAASVSAFKLRLRARALQPARCDGADLSRQLRTRGRAFPGSHGVGPLYVCVGGWGLWGKGVLLGDTWGCCLGVPGGFSLVPLVGAMGGLLGGSVVRRNGGTVSPPRGVGPERMPHGSRA